MREERAPAHVGQSFRRRRVHFELPRFHQEHPVGALGFFEVGGREDAAHFVLGHHPADRRPEFPPREGIDADGRFVEDQKARGREKCDGERELLLHPARELPGRARFKGCEPGGGEHLAGEGLDLPAGDALHAPEEEQVLHAGELGVEPEALRHEGDGQGERGVVGVGRHAEDR